MSSSNVAKRYADALFQIAQEKNVLDTFEQELETVKKVFKSDRTYVEFLEHPKVSNEKKKDILQQAFKGFSKEVLHTLFLLVDRKKVSLVTAVVDTFIDFANEAKGTRVATVYSARALSEEEQKEIVSVFTKKLNLQTLKIKNIADPSVIGGLKIKVGNTVYDGSIKGKLERIERKIMAAN